MTEKMKYIIYRRKEGRRGPGIVRATVSCFFLEFYPLHDQAQLINTVSYWYLEINDTGKAIREIGFNGIDEAIRIAPWRGNLGKWPESNTTFKPEEYEHLSESEFADTWREVEKNKILRRRFVGGKVREYLAHKITWKEFTRDCYYEGDWLIDDIVSALEHDGELQGWRIDALEQ